MQRLRCVRVDCCLWMSFLFRISFANSVLGNGGYINRPRCCCVSFGHAVAKCMSRTLPTGVFRDTSRPLNRFERAFIERVAQYASAGGSVEEFSDEVDFVITNASFNYHRCRAKYVKAVQRTMALADDAFIRSLRRHALSFMKRKADDASVGMHRSVVRSSVEIDVVPEDLMPAMVKCDDHTKSIERHTRSVARKAASAPFRKLAFGIQRMPPGGTSVTDGESDHQESLDDSPRAESITAALAFLDRMRGLL